MSDKPMFFYAAVYDDLESAEYDYDAVKILHAAGDIGSYDVALISKDEDGKVKVHKHEKPTQHGAWIGLAAGAASALLFPALLPALVTTSAVGAGLGAWIGHLAHGMSRSDAKEIGALLDDGAAALIVVGVDKDAEAIQKAVTKAKKQAIKEVHADFAEAEREVDEAIRQA